MKSSQHQSRLFEWKEGFWEHKHLYFNASIVGSHDDAARSWGLQTCEPSSDRPKTNFEIYTLWTLTKNPQTRVENATVNGDLCTLFSHWSAVIVISVLARRCLNSSLSISSSFFILVSSTVSASWVSWTCFRVDLKKVYGEFWKVCSSAKNSKNFYLFAMQPSNTRNNGICNKKDITKSP